MRCVPDRARLAVAYVLRLQLAAAEVLVARCVWLYVMPTASMWRLVPAGQGRVREADACRYWKLFPR